MKAAQNTPVIWAKQNALSALERDCITAVVLKVLDKKCKMPPEQQEVILAIYAVLHRQPGELFDRAVYTCIDQALQQKAITATLAERIHQHRLDAEDKIPKPVMKAFKAKLRHELFERILPESFG